MAISGLTAHGSFVSAGLSCPANLSTLLLQGPALMGSIVSFDTFPDILKAILAVVDKCPGIFPSALFNSFCCCSS